jgi:hypothetical protein
LRQPTIKDADENEPDHSDVMPWPLDSNEEVLLEDVYASVKQEDLRTSLSFILVLQNASLNDVGTGLSLDAIEQLRDSLQQWLSLNDDRALCLTIHLYLELNHSDEDYIKAHAAHIEYDGVELPSLHQIKKIVAELSGVEEMMHDMCMNTCVGFTGPFAGLQHCPECGEAWYDQETLAQTNGKIKTPHKQFVTVPVGPQIQALYHNPQSAQEMCYCTNCTQEIFEELEHENGHKKSWNDFINGSDYIHTVAEGKIKDDDTVLMMSINGAPLYKSKASDCWISIWVIFNHSPETQYKKKYVLPSEN